MALRRSLSALLTMFYRARSHLDLQEEFGRLREVGFVEVAFSDLIANDGPFALHPHGDLAKEVAVLEYTGGTTGEPKAVMLTHANFSTVMSITDAWEGPIPDTHQDKTLCVVPLTHLFGFTLILLRAVVAGTEVVLHLRFDPTKVLQDISAKRVTILDGVPSMWAALINHPDISKFDLSSLRHGGCGGAPLTNEICDRFRDLTGLPLKQGYALTETTGLATRQPNHRPRPDTAGVPLPHTVIEVMDLETGLRALRRENRRDLYYWYR